MTPLFFTWHPDPEIFQWGAFSLRWYGVLFSLGFYVAYWFGVRILKKERTYAPTSELLLIALIVGTFIGARLGHVLFYDVAFYLAQPIEILKIWKGGLSSHGTVVGMLIGLFIYVYGWAGIPGLFKKGPLVPKNPGRYTYIGQMDFVVLVVLVGAIFIRVGNFTNSEIIGTQTDLPWGVVFMQPLEKEVQKRMPQVEKVSLAPYGTQDGHLRLLTLWFKDQNYNANYLKEQLSRRGKLVLKKANGPHAYVRGVRDLDPDFELTKEEGRFKATLLVTPVLRHPAQLYEAFLYLLVLLFILPKYHRENLKNNAGVASGLFLILAFGGRLIIEFFKENQVDAEAGLFLNYGQMLSVPLIILGGYFFLASRKEKWVKRISSH